LKAHPKLPAKLVITGGRQRTFDHNIDEWSGYDRAISIEITNNRGELNISKSIDYLSPNECMAEKDASITFKSGSINHEELWIPTQTEVLQFDPKTYQTISRISHPAFNDVHHVMVSSRNTLIVTSTGLDALFEFSRQGELLNEWSCTDTPVWEKFNQKTDYRRVLTTKPHISHPNFCFEYKGQFWVTRMKQKDTYCVQTGESIALGESETHDGFLVGDNAYFTHVEAHVTKVDMRTKKVVKRYDLKSQNKSKKYFGWCRAFYYINDDYFLVGFTRIRPSKFHQGMQWLNGKIRPKNWPGCHPTMVCLLNTQEMKIEWKLNLEDYDVNAIFSIL